ncbi:MAG: hypothetical protein SGPRY_007674, partial [Prymnesium sp.]
LSAAMGKLHELEDRLTAEREELEGQLSVTRAGQGELERRWAAERGELEGKLSDALANQRELEDRLAAERGKLDGQLTVSMALQSDLNQRLAADREAFDGKLSAAIAKQHELEERLAAETAARCRCEAILWQQGLDLEREGQLRLASQVFQATLRSELQMSEAQTRLLIARVEESQMTNSRGRAEADETSGDGDGDLSSRRVGRDAVVDLRSQLLAAQEREASLYSQLACAQQMQQDLAEKSARDARQAKEAKEAQDAREALAWETRLAAASGASPPPTSLALIAQRSQHSRLVEELLERKDAEWEGVVRAHVEAQEGVVAQLREVRGAAAQERARAVAQAEGLLREEMKEAREEAEEARRECEEARGEAAASGRRLRQLVAEKERLCGELSRTEEQLRRAEAGVGLAQGESLRLNRELQVAVAERDRMAEEIQSLLRSNAPLETTLSSSPTGGRAFSRCVTGRVVF